MDEPTESALKEGVLIVNVFPNQWTQTQMLATVSEYDSKISQDALTPSEDQGRSQISP